MSMKEWKSDAYKLGEEHALNAATWIVDGNSDAAHVRKVLTMIEDGDPMVDEYLPRTPNLSGEYADDPTPLSLYRGITGDMEGEHDPDGAVMDILAEQYEAGVSDTFMEACEAQLRRWLA